MNKFMVGCDAKRPHPIVDSTREDLVETSKNGICFLVNAHEGHPLCPITPSIEPQVATNCA